MQIVQELCKRPGLNRTGFDMQTIFIPQLNKPTKCTNQIENVCLDIEKTINRTVQNTLNTLEKDCANISSLIQQRLDKDVLDRDYNFKSIVRTAVMGSIAAIVPAMLCLHLLISALGTEVMHSVFGEEITASLHTYVVTITLIDY